MVDTDNIKDFEIKFKIKGEKHYNIKDIIELINNQMEEYVGDINSLSIKEVEK